MFRDWITTNFKGLKDFFNMLKIKHTFKQNPWNELFLDSIWNATILQNYYLLMHMKSLLFIFCNEKSLKGDTIFGN
jgi:hypothetical protein